MYEKCLLLNTGSSQGNPVKAFIISGLPGEPVVQGIKLVCQKFSPEASYEQIADIIFSSDLSLSYIADDANFILLRCPALRKNIQGLTLLTPKMVKSLSEITVLKHGSEIAALLAGKLSEKFTLPAVFSRGIPTSNLPDYTTLTGHPEIQTSCLSHWEAAEGIARHLVREKVMPFKEIAYILVMLGSGVGIYTWENGKIVYPQVRHQGGPMSQSSVGGSIDVLTLLDFFIQKDITYTNTKVLQKELKSLSGQTGGFQLYNPEWAELKRFQEDCEKGNPLALKLFQAWIFQIVTRIGAARMAMFEHNPTEKVPLRFFGGGANWNHLVEEIIRHTGYTFISDFKAVDDYDPEIEFFISQAQEFTSTGQAVSYDDLVS